MVGSLYDASRGRGPYKAASLGAVIAWHHLDRAEGRNERGFRD
jgi:hypothetical protein